MLQRLPPITDPHAYVGLFVYDFGTHVSVGYTAAELRVLRESPQHRHGTAYEIYRVGENGAIELRGVLDERPAGTAAMCFSRFDAAAATRDFQELKKAAESLPAPADVELVLMKCYAWEPPNVTALFYPATASHRVAGWLSEIGFAGGDKVDAGIDVCAKLLSSSAMRIASFRLPSRIAYADRSAEEVLESVDQPLQR